MNTSARLVERTGPLGFAREGGILGIGVHENADLKAGHCGEMHQVKSVVRIEADVCDDPIVPTREKPLARAVEIGVNLDLAEQVGAADQLLAQVAIWLDEQHTHGHILTVSGLSNQGAISAPAGHVSVKHATVACNVLEGPGLQGIVLTGCSSVPDSDARQMRRFPLEPHGPGLLAVASQAERAFVPVEDLVVLRDRHSNVMIVGPDVATDAALGEIQPLLRLPITVVRVDSQAGLPLALNSGTLVLRGVAALAWTEQLRLHGWLARTAGMAQVVSTSGQPMLPLVEKGIFLNVLYYRLNMTYLEVGSP